MPLDIQQLKVPTFEDVNDEPTAPTSTKAGNGSHLILQHNLLVDSTEQAINDLQDSLNSLPTNSASANNWIVVENDYIANPGDKIVFKTNQPVSGKSIYYLNLPSSPPLGTNISFINTNGSIIVDVRNFSKFNGGYAIRIYTQDAYKLRTLVYVGQGIGWLPTTPDDYLKEYGGGT